MSENQQLIDYLLLLRYGGNQNIILDRPIINILDVAKVSGIKYSTVRGLLRLGV